MHTANSEVLNDPLLCEKFLYGLGDSAQAVCWSQFTSENKLEIGSFSYERPPHQNEEAQYQLLGPGDKHTFYFKRRKGEGLLQP